MKRKFLFAGIVLVFTALLSSGEAEAQISSKGREFFFTFMECDLSPDSLLVYVTSDKNCKFTIDNPRVGGTTKNYNVVANQITRVKVDAGNYFVTGSEQPVGTARDYGLRLKADADVYVYVLSIKQYRSDGTFVLPTSAIPYNPEYIISSYTPTDRTGFTGPYSVSEFMIVAIDNNTQVEIIPKSRTRGGVAAGTPMTVSLQLGQIYQVQSNTADGSTGANPTGSGDMTGTIVRVKNGCKRINVFAGMEAVKLPQASCNTRDHLFGQMLPTTMWGKNYIISPFKGMTQGYLYRVLPAQDGTKIWVNGVLQGTYNKTFYFQENVGTASLRQVTSDKPVMVVQYMKSQNCNGANDGDPAILVMPDISQMVTLGIVGTAHTANLNDHYINIIVDQKFKNLVRLDGSPIATADWGGSSISGYTWAQIKVSNGAHVVKCDSGMIAVMYGYGNYESYAYCAGATFENLLYDMKVVQNGKCPQIPVYFTGSGSNALGFTWYFGDGTKDTGSKVTHRYMKPGSYTARMVAKIPGICGTYDSVVRTKIIDVFNGPAPTFQDTLVICDTVSVLLDPGYNVKWQYKWNDSSTVSKKTVKNAGKYWVKIIDTSLNCVAYDSILLAKPNKVGMAVAFDTARSCFRGNYFVLRGNSSITGDAPKTETWLLPGNIYSFSKKLRTSFDTTGSYNIKYYLRTQKGCFDSLTVKVNVYSHPKAGFYNDTSFNCPGTAFAFYDTSKALFKVDTVKQYRWNFGDGSSSVLKNPFKYYTTGDSFKVMQRVITQNGCEDTAYRTLYLYRKPQAAFTLSDTLRCLNGNLFTATNNSSVSAGSLAGREWTYNAKTETVKDTLQGVAFASAGKYTIRLITISDKQCRDTVSKTVRISAHPQSGFSVSDTVLCQKGNKFTFTNTSEYLNGAISKQKWTWGDGNGDTSRNPGAKIYTTAGKYTITLAVVNKDGCTDTSTGSVRVVANPKAGFNINDTDQCVAQNKFIYTNSSVINTNPKNYEWSYGDGNSSTNTNNTYTYATPGTYFVVLIAKTDKGCADTITRRIQVLPGPTANYSVDKNAACRGNADFKFTDLSTFAGGTVSSRYWTFGDGTNSSTQNPSKTYSNTEGNFPIRLIIYGANGCNDTADGAVDVWPKPAAKYNVNDDIQCFQGHSFVFSDNSTINSGTVSTRSWTFGQGGTGTGINPAPQTYTAAGTYNIVLAVASDKACVDTARGTVQLVESPVVDFDTDTACLGEDISLSGNGVLSTGTIVRYTYMLGTGDSVNTQNLTYRYKAAGTYTITFKAVSDQGCVGSKSVPGAVVIYPSPVAKFTETRLGGQGFNTDVQFNDQSTGATQWLWNFGDGQISNLQNPKITFTDSGHYTNILTVVNNDGCWDSAHRTIFLIPETVVYMPSSFSPNKDRLNEILKPEGISVVKRYEFEVYNRWGERVFQTRNVSEGWDGTYDGKPVPEGVYAYRIYVIGFDGKIVSTKGDVTILR